MLLIWEWGCECVGSGVVLWYEQEDCQVANKLGAISIEEYGDHILSANHFCTGPCIQVWLVLCSQAGTYYSAWFWPEGCFLVTGLRVFFSVQAFFVVIPPSQVILKVWIRCTSYIYVTYLICHLLWAHCAHLCILCAHCTHFWGGCAHSLIVGFFATMILYIILW